MLKIRRTDVVNRTLFTKQEHEGQGNNWEYKKFDEWVKFLSVN